MNKSRVRLLSSILILTFLGLLHKVQAQKIAEIEGGYIMNDRVFLKKDMKDIFKDSPEALGAYNKAYNQKKIGDISLGLGAGSTIAGLVMVKYGRSVMDRNDDLLEAIVNGIGGGIFVVGGYLILATAVGLVTISIINYSSSAGSYKRALQEYRWSEIEKHGYNKDDVSIQAEVTGNGVSLTYNF